ncbi:MAG: TrmH family RNA methyltransferase [Flavobacteriaceae bacterium]
MEPELLRHLESFLTPRRRTLFDRVLSERTRWLTVVTEDVYQMHNTSAVMRSCDVFGIQDLHVIEKRFGKRVDKEIAMGAQKWVDIYRHNDAQGCIKTLRNQGYQIVATSPRHGEPLSTFDLRQKSALVFGTEKNGISPELMQEADRTLTIPMHGFTESLNISVSAAIILNDLVSKLRIAPVDWTLSEQEKYAIKCRWTKASIKDAVGIIERFKSKSK